MNPSISFTCFSISSKFSASHLEFCGPIWLSHHHDLVLLDCAL
uniref:Uncharacterized protein n=1 Tax=Arundo donax TaxID=35708 RepID=A0A0A8ZUS3_ARUDO